MHQPSQVSNPVSSSSSSESLAVESSEPPTYGSSIVCNTALSSAGSRLSSSGSWIWRLATDAVGADGILALESRPAQTITAAAAALDNAAKPQDRLLCTVTVCRASCRSTAVVVTAGSWS